MDHDVDKQPYYNVDGSVPTDNNSNNALDSQAYEDIGQRAPARPTPLDAMSELAPATWTTAAGGGVEQQYSEINFATALAVDTEQQSDPGSMTAYTRLDSLDRLRDVAAHSGDSASSQYTSLTHTAHTRNN